MGSGSSVAKKEHVEGEEGRKEVTGKEVGRQKKVVGDAGKTPEEAEEAWVAVIHSKSDLEIARTVMHELANVGARMKAFSPFSKHKMQIEDGKVIIAVLSPSFLKTKKCTTALRRGLVAGIPWIAISLTPDFTPAPKMDWLHSGLQHTQLSISITPYVQTNTGETVINRPAISDLLLQLLPEVAKHPACGVSLDVGGLGSELSDDEDDDANESSDVIGRNLALFGDGLADNDDRLSNREKSASSTATDAHSHRSFGRRGTYKATMKNASDITRALENPPKFTMARAMAAVTKLRSGKPADTVQGFCDAMDAVVLPDGRECLANANIVPATLKVLNQPTSSVDVVTAAAFFLVNFLARNDVVLVEHSTAIQATILTLLARYQHVLELCEQLLILLRMLLTATVGATRAIPLSQSEFQLICKVAITHATNEIIACEIVHFFRVLQLAPSTKESHFVHTTTTSQRRSASSSSAADAIGPAVEKALATLLTVHTAHTIPHRLIRSLFTQFAEAFDAEHQQENDQP